MHTAAQQQRPHMYQSPNPMDPLDTVKRWYHQRAAAVDHEMRAGDS